MTDVSDGDTITLSGVGRVRLIGADTPEVFGGAECFGRAASSYTKRVLRPGRRVRYRLGIESRDRYGRALAYVWLRDGRMFNGLLVLRGFALPLAIAPNTEYARRFRVAARRARRLRRGLWGRRGCARDAAQSSPTTDGVILVTTLPRRPLPHVVLRMLRFLGLCEVVPRR